MHHVPRLILALALLGGSVWAQGFELGWKKTTLPVVALHRVDGPKQADLLIAIGAGGEVRTVRGMAAEGEDLDLGGTLVLPGAETLLYDFAEILGDGGAPELVTLSAAGLQAYRFGEDGFYGGEPVRLDGRRRRGRARFGIRTGVPRRSEFCRDVNGDGIADVLVPDWTHCELWTRAPGEGPIRFRRAARLQIRRNLERRAEGTRLSDEWESTFVLSSLTTRDVNGDGRADILTGRRRQRAWYLQAEDGTFPEEPSVTLDADLFRDTSPKAKLRPGRVLAGDDRQTVQTGDLDGDGVPDTVISHRRTIWVFRGGAEGPRFDEPTQVLRASEDVTALLLLRLDDDAAADLVAIKVEVPSIGSLLVGALGGLDVEMSAVGYRAKGDGTFERKPKWRGKLVLQLPSLTEVIRDPQKIIRRFEEVGERVEGFVEGDVDGDGKPDLLKTSTEGDELRWWRSVASKEVAADQSILREILFGQGDRKWDLDDVLKWLSRVVDSERVRRTGNRDPDGIEKLALSERADLEATILADVDGDGRDEVIFCWRLGGPGSGLAFQPASWKDR